MDRVSEIINAAQELFKSYGFTKTTMTDIASRLDTSKASLYYYFKDKESIFRALAEKEQLQFVEEINKIINNSTEAKTKLLGYTEKRLDLLQKMLTLSSFNRENYTAIRPLFSSIIQEFRIKEMNLVHEIIQKGVQRNEFKAINIDEHTQLFLGVLQGLRHVAFSKSENKESRIIPDNEYDQLKKQSVMFTEMFLHSISK